VDTQAQGELGADGGSGELSSSGELRSGAPSSGDLSSHEPSSGRSLSGSPSSGIKHFSGWW
jgi:hypothetical protein